MISKVNNYYLKFKKEAKLYKTVMSEYLFDFVLTESFPFAHFKKPAYPHLHKHITLSVTSTLNNCVT